MSKETHLSHCYQGENKDNCKYSDKDCPAKPKSCGEKHYERVEFDEWFVCGELDYTGEVYYCDKCREDKKPTPIRSKIITALLEELYKNEIIDTNMRGLTIGEGKDFSSKEEWMENRLEGLE